MNTLVWAGSAVAAIAVVAVVVLVLALRRRRRPALEGPRTVAELVRLRSDPATVPAAEPGLAAEPGPAAAVPEAAFADAGLAAADPDAVQVTGPLAAASPADPVPAASADPDAADGDPRYGQVEAIEDDAPWRRAARMAAGSGSGVEFVPRRPAEPVSGPEVSDEHDSWTGWSDWAEVDAEENDARATSAPAFGDLGLGAAPATDDAGQVPATDSLPAGDPAAGPPAVETPVAERAAAESVAAPGDEVAPPGAVPEEGAEPSPTAPAAEPTVAELLVAELAAAKAPADEPTATEPPAAEPPAEKAPHRTTSPGAASPGAASLGAASVAAASLAAVPLVAASAQEPPAERSPEDDSPPAEPSDAGPTGPEAAVDEAAVDEAAVDEAAVDEAAVDEAPVSEAPVDEAPVSEAPGVWRSLAAPPADLGPDAAAPAEEGPADPPPVADVVDAASPAGDPIAAEDPVVGSPVDQSRVVEPSVAEPAAHEASPTGARMDEAPVAEPSVDEPVLRELPPFGPVRVEPAVPGSRGRRSAVDQAAEQAAADLALLRTFGFADPSLGPDTAPVVSLAGATAPEPELEATGATQPVRFRAVRRDGSPVPGATVMLLDDRGREVSAGTAADDGRGDLVAPHAGGYVVVATAPAHQPGAVALTVEDVPAAVDVLLARSASVSGAVHGEDGPLADARVTLVQDGEIVDSASTSPDGSYRLEDLAAGEYGLSVAAAGCTPLATLLLVPDETDLCHDVDLEPADRPPAARRPADRVLGPDLHDVVIDDAETDGAGMVAVAEGSSRNG